MIDMNIPAIAVGIILLGLLALVGVIAFCARRDKTKESETEPTPTFKSYTEPTQEPEAPVENSTPTEETTGKSEEVQQIVTEYPNELPPIEVECKTVAATETKAKKPRKTANKKSTSRKSTKKSST
jgi:hypothetical protein